MEKIKSNIRIVEGFPKEGISFKDITTLLKTGDEFQFTIDQIIEDLKDKRIDMIIGPESRGFILGAPVAYGLGAGFAPVRKAGKLPAETLKMEYELEYGTDALEIHVDAIQPGQRIAIVDDLLATGGTISSTIELIEKLGGEIVSINFLIELTGLEGRAKLAGYRVNSLIQYEF
jgi:adenine phosphoribosyltransferase